MLRRVDFTVQQGWLLCDADACGKIYKIRFTFSSILTRVQYRVFAVHFLWLVGYYKTKARPKTYLVTLDLSSRALQLKDAVAASRALSFIPNKRVSHSREVTPRAYTKTSTWSK